MPSTLEDNKALVRRYYETVVSTGDVSDIESFIAPDYVEVHHGEVYPVGLDGAIKHVRGVRAVYDQLTVTVDRQIAEGEWVATAVTARGRHTGEWIGIAPTGREVAFTGVNFDRVVNGRIVEHGGAANMLGPLLEIGAVEVVGPDGH